MANQVVAGKLKTNPTSGTVRYSGLSPRESRALNALRKELRAILPNGELQSLYLYGSKPRGDASIHSDIDVFLVYDDVTPEQENALQEFVVEHLGKPPSIHLFLYRAADVLQANGSSPLIYNVSHHGILLEGKPVPKLDIDRRKVAYVHLKHANDNLETAGLALNADKFNNTVSLAYYAAYYAADSALASKGFVAQSHSGTETLLTIHFIRTGLIPDSFKGLLGRGHKARIQADYEWEIEFNRDDAEYWLGRAKEFVTLVSNSLENGLAEPSAKSE